MKATKTTIQERLMISNDNYEMMIMQIWTNWCTDKVKDKKNLQKVMCCPPLFNWWMRELQILEQQFIDETLPFDCPVHAKKMYCEWTIDIFGKFSKPLLKLATKNPQNDSN